MRSKSILCKRCLPIFILLFSAGLALGSYFQYYDGGLTASCNNYSEDYWYLSGPYHASQTGTENVLIEDYSAVLQASSFARNSVVTIYGGSSVHLRVFSTSVAMSLDIDGYAYSNGNTETVSGSNIGIFYKIQPDAGEAEGDNVIIRWDGALSIEPTGLVPGSVSGYLAGPGSMDHLAITKGQLPPVTVAPDPNKEVWTMPNLTINNTFYYAFEEIERFSAKIGDVIGVFFSCGTSNVVSGAQLGTVYSNLTVTFTIESLLGDLDGDGDVDFHDFAMLAEDWLVGK